MVIVRNSFSGIIYPSTFVFQLFSSLGFAFVNLVKWIFNNSLNFYGDSPKLSLSEFNFLSLVNSILLVAEFQAMVFLANR